MQEDIIVTPLEVTPLEKPRSWLDRPVFSNLTLNWEVLIFAIIIIVAIGTRFYDVGTRVMSHDESLHTYFSWKLYRGEGFQHTPMMHGPLQFHALAFFYFLLGDSDFSARIFAVLTNVAMIGFMWQYRRYLGRVGAIIAAGLLTISPFILYYGRYVRNEAYVGLFGIVALWAILRYLEEGENKYLYWLAGATVLHFIAKETAFFYTAQAMVFLGLLFVQRVSQQEWVDNQAKRLFLFLLTATFAFILLGATITTFSGSAETLSATETAVPADPTQAPESTATLPPVAIVFAAAGVLSLLGSLYFLARGYTLDKLRTERSFELIILLGTLVLPHLAAFPVHLLSTALPERFGHWNPLDYTQEGMLRTAIFLVPMAIAAILIGLWWKPRAWLICNGIFYGFFVVFFTTLFTNSIGFFTGLVGSLGYWLEQQGVERGSQPWYYYLAIQIPLYEYLPALGSVLAFYMVLRNKLLGLPIGEDPGADRDASEPTVLSPQTLTLALFGFWSVTSFVTYTIAGEKMPWLTYHITLPMIMVTSWALGNIIKNTDWAKFRAKNGVSVIALSIIFLLSFFAALTALFGPTPPFQGDTLEQLGSTSNFLTGLITAIFSGVGLFYALRGWEGRQFRHALILTVFGLLAILTTRTAFYATYINFDNATEYMVYAHSARGVKDVLTQVEDLSRRTDGNLSMPVAYDDDISWPFTWYLRNYTNQRYYGQEPTRDLRDVPVILVGDNNFSKVEPIVARNYYQFDYIRMWWPNQDYFNLSSTSIEAEIVRDFRAQSIEEPPSVTASDYWGTVWKHVQPFFTDAAVRQAIWDIWFYRDYDRYAELRGTDMSLPRWSPADTMRMYIRKDIANTMWDYGVAAAAVNELTANPYDDKDIVLPPDQSFGNQGTAPGQFMQPRGLAVAEDGSIYVADSRNHRIQHLNPDGSVIHTWGTFADVAAGPADPGTFNEPWDVAIGADGSVFVVDTWNHRIQKFTPEGVFVTMWGIFGQGETPEAFWGPRAIAIDADGRVFVMDTGNKRVAVFDEHGSPLGEFGGVGFDLGKFDEPVGLAVDNRGNVFIADTWNQRMQVAKSMGDNTFLPALQWDIVGWYGNSLDNKPYVAVDADGRLFVTDPEGYRVLEFTSEGEFVKYWGDYSTGADGFGLASGIAVDPTGGLWVSDAGNNRLLHFVVP